MWTHVGANQNLSWSRVLRHHQYLSLVFMPKFITWELINLFVFLDEINKTSGFVLFWLKNKAVLLQKHQLH